MKKYLRSAMMIALVLMVGIGLAACGGKGGEDTEPYLGTYSFEKLTVVGGGYDQEYNSWAEIEAAELMPQLPLQFNLKKMGKVYTHLVANLFHSHIRLTAKI